MYLKVTTIKEDKICY